MSRKLSLTISIEDFGQAAYRRAMCVVAVCGLFIYFYLFLFLLLDSIWNLFLKEQKSGNFEIQDDDNGGEMRLMMAVESWGWW